MSGIKERGDPLSGFFTKLLRSDTLTSFFKNFVLVRSCAAACNLLQPTGCVNSTPHTSHFLVDSQHFQCHIDVGSRTKCVAHFISSHPCAHVACCLILSNLLLFAFRFLSHLPFHSPDHLLLPRGRQEPCALLLTRSQALWPRTILSQLTDADTRATKAAATFAFRELTPRFPFQRPKTRRRKVMHEIAQGEGRCKYHT